MMETPKFYTESQPTPSSLVHPEFDTESAAAMKGLQQKASLHHQLFINNYPQN
jgi:hypothetical protein